MGFYLAAVIQGLCFGLLALGIYLSMKIFNIPDITTDGSYTLGGAVTAVLLGRHQSLCLILPVVLAAGAAAGAITGLIHTRLKMNALLAGILVMTALYSVNLAIMGRSNLPLVGLASIFSIVSVSANSDINTFAIALVIILVAVVKIGYLLKTDYGIAMRATGNSETMVKAMGVNVNRMKITGLALANAFTALSGFLMVQYQGFADINMGIGVVIIGLGSVIIAESLVLWLGAMSVWLKLLFVITGAILFQLSLALALSAGVDPTWLKLVTAAIVLLIAGLPRFLQRTA